jgi:hypothetical protein
MARIYPPGDPRRDGPTPIIPRKPKYPRYRGPNADKNKNKPPTKPKTTPPSSMGPKPMPSRPKTINPNMPKGSSRGPKPMPKGRTGGRKAIPMPMPKKQSRKKVY